MIFIYNLNFVFLIRSIVIFILLVIYIYFFFNASILNIQDEVHQKVWVHIPCTSHKLPTLWYYDWLNNTT